MGKESLVPIYKPVIRHQRQRLVAGWVLALLLAWLWSLAAVEPLAAQAEITPSSPCFASTNLTNLATGGNRGITNQPVISGNGNRVSFWSVNNLGGGNVDGNIEIFVGDTGTNSIVQLTDSVGSILGGFNLEPSINAAGTHIAFYSDRDLVAGQNADGNFEIYLARLGGNGQWTITQITNTEGSANLFPSINAAGDRIAFVSDDSELHNIDQNRANVERNFEIFLATILPSGQVEIRQVTDTGAGITNDQPVIDAAGNRIAFTAGTGQSSQIWVWDQSNSNPTQLTQTDINDQPSISADGTNIVYVATNQDDRSRIVLHSLSADGSESRAEVIVPTATNTKYRSPSISGGGNRVAYVAEQGTGDAIQINVLLYDVNTGLGVPISELSGGTGEQPALSSDGTRVAFVGVRGVAGATDDAGSDIYINECPVADLVLSFVTPPPTRVLAGVNVEYQFVVTNRGPSVATDAFIRSDLKLLPALPANVSRSLPSGCSIDASNVLVCSLGDLAVNASRTFAIGYEVPSNAGLADIVSNFEVGANIVDSNRQDNATGEFRTTIYEEASLALAVTPDTSTLLAGSPEILTYDIVITNGGPSQARNTSLVDALPSGATLVSVARISGGGAGAVCPSIANDTQVLCELGNLTAGSTTHIQLKIRAKASAPDSFFNLATVSSVTNEVDLTNNSVTTSTTIDRASDMSITKSASPSGSVVAGREITYTFLVTNSGFADTTGVTLIDTLPQHVTYVRTVPSAGTTCTPSGAGQIVTCTFDGQFLVNQSGSVSFVALVASTAPADTITNTARVFSDRRDPNTANDTTPPVLNQVTHLADLVTAKTVNKAQPDVGEIITYTVKVRNDGPSQATDVVVADSLPVSMTFVSASATVGNYNSGTGLWELSSPLLVGQEQTLTIAARPENESGGQTVVNTATASGSQPEPPGGIANSTDSVSIVPQRADVHVTKVASEDPVRAGRPLTYTITVKNQGPSLARSVHITDVLPSDVFLISATAPITRSACITGTTITCNVGNMAAGVEFVYTVVVTRELKGIITNTVSVSSPTPDIVTNNNEATLPVMVNAAFPHHLVFTIQPPDLVTAGDVFVPIPKVEIRDRFNNLIDTTSGSTDNIRLLPYTNTACTNLATSSALINGQINATGGVATFTGIHYTKAETIYLKAEDVTPGRNVATACSTVITVNPAGVKQLVFTTVPRTLVAGEISQQITVERRDQYNNINTVGDFTVQLSENSPSTGTFLDKNDGTGNTITSLVIPDTEANASFYYTDTIAGSYVITASAPGGITPAVQTITVAAAPARDLLVVISSPPTTTAGISSDLITVQRTDPFGNPNLTDDPVTVGLSSDSPAGSGGNPIFRNTANTVNLTSVTIPTGQSTATFRYRDTLARTHTLAVTDITDGVDPEDQLLGDTISLAVIPASTHYLLITSPTQVITAGVESAPIQVVREDIFGNRNFADPDLLVNLATSSTGVGRAFTPPAPVTIVQGTDHVEFTYSDSLAGTHVITASSGSLLPGSQQITVTADVPSQLAIITTTNSIVAGAPPFTITLQRQDQFGNPALLGDDLEIFLQSNSSIGNFLALDEDDPPINSVTIIETDVSFRYEDNSQGVWTLLFTDNMSGPFDVTQQLTVTAAVATQLVFTRYPETVIAGMRTGIFEVERRDTFGNPNSATVPLMVHLTTTSAGPSMFISGTDGLSVVTTVQIPAGSPTTTFYYNDQRAGVHTITADDNDPIAGIAPATTTLTVESAAATKLVFINQSRSITAGTTSEPLLVQIQDTFSNPVTPTASAPITVNLTTSAASPPARFRNEADTTDIISVTISGSSTGRFRYYDEKAGSPSITTDDVGTLLPDADVVTVVAAPADHLVFTSNPLTLTAGVTSTVITVQRRDPFNNPNTSDPAVTLTLTTTSAGTARFINSTTDALLPSGNRLTILAGSSQARFRYYDTKRAQPVITASSVPTLTAASQQQTVLGAEAVWLKITGNGTQVAGDAQQVGLVAYDAFGNQADPYDGSRTLTFGGAQNAPDGTEPTVSDSSGIPVTFGTGTPVVFSAGIATAGGNMRLYDAASNVVITATDTISEIHAVGSDALTVTVSATMRNKVSAETASSGTGSAVPDQTLASGSTLTLWAVGRDQYDNVTGNVATASWHITATGGVSTTDIAPASGVSTTFTARQLGTAVLEPRVAGSVSEASGLITVGPATATTVSVETAADGSGTRVSAQSLVAGDTITVYAVARDALGNYAGNPAATWTIVTGTVNVTTANNLTPTIGSPSTVFTAKQVGSGHIRATVSGLSSRDSGLMTIVPGPATRFGVVNGGVASMTAGESRALTITAFDSYNNTATSYTGTHTLTFSGPLSSTRPVTPPTVVDRLGTPRIIGQPVEISFNAGVSSNALSAGTITLYHAPLPNPAVTVTVSAGAIGGSVSFDVVSGITNKLAIDSLSGTNLSAGVPVSLTLRAEDLYGNLVTGYTGGRNLRFSGSPDPNLPGFPATVRSSTAGSGPTDIAFGTNTNINFSSGMATTSAGNNGVMKLYKTGTFVISVQQANGQYSSGAYGSLSVNVGPSPSQILALALPASSINRGVFPSPSTVTLKDIYGNPVPVRPVTITTSLPGSITIAGSGGDHVLDEPDDFNPSTGVADLSATGLAMRYTGLADHGIFTATTANPLGGMLVATDIVEIKHDTPTTVHIRGTTANANQSNTLQVVAGTPVSVTLRLFDADGNPAIDVDTMPLDFTLTPSSTNPPAKITGADGTSVLVDGTAVIHFDNGISNVDAGGGNGLLTIYEEGTYVLRVSKDAPDPIATGSGEDIQITVVPGPLNQLTWAVSGDQTNNAIFTNGTLTARDAYSNVLTNFDTLVNPVTLSVVGQPTATVQLADGGNVLAPGDFVNGVADLQAKGLTYTGLSGTIQFRATAQSGTIGDINVNILPAPVAQLSLAGPSSATAGTPFSVTVTGRDLSGNPITDGLYQVTFTGASSGSDGRAPVVGGNAFDTPFIVYLTGGSVTVPMTLTNAIATNINATIGSLVSNQLSVTVAPGALNELTWSAIGDQTNNQSFSHGTLTAHDAYENVIANFNDPVTISQTTQPTGTVVLVNSGGDNVLEPGDFASGVADLNAKGLRYTGLAGTIQLHASALSGAITSTTNVNILPGPLAQLSLTGPSNATAGQSFDVTVTGRDSSGSLIADGPYELVFNGAIPAPDGTQPTANGVNFGTPFTPTFGGGSVTVSLILPNAATSNVIASSGALDSNPLEIPVSPAELASFAVVISSPQVLTTTLSNPPNTITALDAYNNVVTDFAVDANPVTVTRTQGSAASYTITGLGSGNDDTLNQAGDFVNGVADLTGKLVYSAGSGEVIKFRVQTGSVVGESNEVLYEDPP